MLKRVAMAMIVALSSAAAASAQTGTTGSTTSQPSGQSQPATASPPATSGQPATSMAVERRPATTTFRGDTGLWFVPTGEVLPAGRVSMSAYRVNFDHPEGFTDVSNWPVTIGFGLGDRAEIFGAFDVIRRIDRDSRPLFTNNQGGGLVNDYPFVSDGWSGNQIGDLWLGTKVNLSSQWRQQPLAFGLRGLVKVPIAKDDEEGVGSGKMDFAIDAILSKELNNNVELSGYGGMIFRGDPDETDLTNGFRWGIGAGFPTRKNLRFTAELHGEQYLDDTLVLTRSLIAADGSIAPGLTALSSPIDASFGLTYQASGGMFFGAGLNWRLGMDGRSEFGTFEDEGGDYIGLQVRIGYHPGVRIYVPPPPPPPPAAPPVQAAAHDLTVKADCNPCTVEPGKASTVTATPRSSIGCSVTYAWSAPTGTLADRAARSTTWTAPCRKAPSP